MGRKNKPTHLKIIDGNPGGKPINYDEPVPEEIIADSPPVWLGDYAKEYWKEAVEQCPEGMLRQLDASVLITWCVAMETLRIAQEEFQRDPQMTVVNEVTGAVKQNPLLSIIRCEGATVIRCASEMGFSPSSRAKVSAPAGGKGNGKKTNPFKKFST